MHQRLVGTLWCSKCRIDWKLLIANTTQKSVLKEVVIKRNRLIFWRTSLRGTNSRNDASRAYAMRLATKVPTVTDHIASDVIWPELFHSRFSKKVPNLFSLFWCFWFASHNVQTILIFFLLAFLSNSIQKDRIN